MAWTASRARAWSSWKRSWVGGGEAAAGRGRALRARGCGVAEVGREGGSLALCGRGCLVGHAGSRHLGSG